VFLAESAQGLITQYEILERKSARRTARGKLRWNATKGKSSDTPPKLYSAEPRFPSEAERKSLAQRKAVPWVCIPQRGGKKTEGAHRLRGRVRISKKGQPLSSRHRGDHLRPYSAVRGMKRCLAEGSRSDLNLGRCRRAGQQPDENCGPARTIFWRQTKSSVTVSSDFPFSLTPRWPTCFSFAVAPSTRFKNSRWLSHYLSAPGLLKIPLKSWRSGWIFTNSDVLRQKLLRRILALHPKKRPAR